MTKSETEKNIRQKIYQSIYLKERTDLMELGVDMITAARDATTLANNFVSSEDDIEALIHDYNKLYLN